MRGDSREDALGNADPGRSGEAISRLWLAFLDTYLKGRPSKAYDYHLKESLKDTMRPRPDR
jgi:hypothetical protein